MRSLVSLLLPGLALAIVTLAAALPWGLADPFKPALPLLPYLVVHFWAERRPRAMPDWLVFLAGLATDVVGQGPLGLWALVFLAGYALVRSAAADRPDAGGSILLFGVTAAALVALQWLVISLYYLRLAEAEPLIGAAAIALVVYTVLIVLRPVRGEEARRFNDRLERGT